MDHVPTLVALSTVGIAASGLALGRGEQSPLSRPPSNKRKAAGVGDNFRSFSSPLMSTTSNNFHNISSSSPSPAPGALLSRKEASRAGRERIPAQDRIAAHGRAHTASLSSPSSTPLAENLSPRVASHHVTKPLTNRSSSSWLHRSTSTGSSFNESNSTPATPSISHSNRSSIAILPTKFGPAAVQQPNKLVKRTTSHHVLRQSPTSSSTFRRPATSHQRSANFRQQIVLDEVAEPADSEKDIPTQLGTEEAIAPPTWRPFFGREYSQQAQSQPRKRHTSGFTKSTYIKTIKSGSKEVPTLLMANLIEPRLSEDDIDDREDRPATRMESGSAEFPTSQEQTPRGEGRGSQDKNRHSFSLGEIFSSSPSGWRVSRSESLRKKKTIAASTDTVRHVSSPLVPPPSRSSRQDRSLGNRLQRRRNITDPSLFKAPHVPPQLDLTSGIGSLPRQRDHNDKSPLPPLNRLSGFDMDMPAGTPTFPSTTFSEARGLTSNSNHLPSGTSSASAPHNGFGTVARQKRNSQAGSDPASTLIGSDGETRVFTSGDEDSMDFQSDTAYDSLATRATASSHSGLRGPRIETIFDESPPRDSAKDKLVPLEDLIQGGSFSERFSSKSSRISIVDDDDDMNDFSTPIRAPSGDLSVNRFIEVQSMPDADEGGFPSSPPLMASSLRGESTHTANAQSIQDHMALDEDEFWNDPDNRPSMDHSSPNLPLTTADYQTSLPLRTVSTRPRNPNERQDAHTASKRSSIFEWSEQQKADKENAKGTSPRPKTVHGKQGNDGRGSRAPGRRGPSALHLRSQSVPVTREANPEGGAIHTNGKFGTWGLGNKGVSEEWNDDFDFEEAEEQRDIDEDELDVDNTIERGGMKVPQSIIDRQASIHVQFGQVQDLTLLVEELKRLRAQAMSLHLLDGPSSSLWADAEAIVNLATLDDDEDEFRFPHSPGSPTFGFDDFEDDFSPGNRGQHPTHLSKDGERRRNSVFRRSTSTPATPPTGRPRGESTAQAKTFLQTMYQNRPDMEASLAQKDAEPPRKLPFDTQDLRNLVTRAGVLTRALKEIVRKADGVTQSPDSSPAPRRDPPFSQIFTQSQEERSGMKQGLPKSQSAHSYLGGSMGSSNESDIAGHMKMMTVA